MNTGLYNFLRIPMRPFVHSDLTVISMTREESMTCDTKFFKNFVARSLGLASFVFRTLGRKCLLQPVIDSIFKISCSAKYFTLDQFAVIGQILHPTWLSQTYNRQNIQLL